MRQTTAFCGLLLFTILTTPGADAANYFKCKDEAGNVTFSDTECPSESEVLTEKTVRKDTLSGHLSKDAFQDGSGMSLEAMLKLRQQLAQALSALAALKTASAEYYLSEGSWAPRLESLGFDPALTSSEQIESVKLGRQGELVAKLRDSLGADKMVVLSPHEAMDGTLIEWDCAANFSPLVMSDMACESRKIYP